MAAACISNEDAPCGGFTQNPCHCAPGLLCVSNRIPDIPGTCEPDRCCPVGWDLFTCNDENGTKGLNCHNRNWAARPRSLAEADAIFR
jgi:hypothetical protein